MGKGKLYKFLDPQGTYDYKLDPDPRKTNPDLKKLFTLFTTINKIKKQVYSKVRKISMVSNCIFCHANNAYIT